MILARHGARPAVSEVMGSLIMIAVTLVAGAAVFGFVNGASGSSAGAVGNSAANNINFLNEHTSFVTEYFTAASGGACVGPIGTLCPGASIWVYNNGGVSYTLHSIEIKSVPGPNGPGFIDVIFYQTLASCPTGQQCGYAEYDYNSAPIATCTVPTGTGLPAPNPVIPRNNLQSYSVTIPVGTNCGSVSTGNGYTVKMTGVFGSSVQTTVGA